MLERDENLRPDFIQLDKLLNSAEFTSINSKEDIAFIQLFPFTERCIHCCKLLPEDDLYYTSLGLLCNKCFIKDKLLLEM